MRSLAAFFGIVCSLLLAANVAQARVSIDVDLSTQRMHVRSDGGANFVWAVSSARRGYVTPRGTYHPTSLQVMHYSHKYHMSPMPHSIFFRGGYAIHGTYETAHLGRPASHGCIRISPQHAALLFKLVRAEGATIHIVGAPPYRHYIAHNYHHARYHKAAWHHGHTLNRRELAGRRDRAGTLAYAPIRRAPPIDGWLRGPGGF